MRAALLVLLAAAGAALVVGLVAVAGAKPNLIVGTVHRDHLVGTGGADLIKGRGTGDRIDGRGGADLLYGQRGFDRITGRRGGDVLLGGPGGAALVGGSGRDEFNAVDGKPVGGRGHDVIRARDHRRDVINCGPGRDVAYVDRAEDGVFGCERIVQPSSGQKRVRSR